MSAILIHKIKNQNYEFRKEMNFNIKQRGRESNRDKTLIKLLHASYHGFRIFKHNILPSELDKLCDRLTLLLSEEQAGDIGNIFNH